MPSPRAAKDEPAAIVAHVTAKLRDFIRAVPLADDLTCLVLRYVGPRAALGA